MKAEKISINIDTLVKDIRRLFKGVLQKTEESDKLAMKSGEKWHKRHRLHVLLNATEKSRRNVSKGIIIDPWFISELNGIRELSLRWKDKPVWAILKKSMINKEHFRHTIGKLLVAEHFAKSHKVELVPIGKGASPDLRVQATGGMEAWLYVECYQPTKLSGQSVELDDRSLKKIINKSMDKAKRQFSATRPGLIVILVYNQTNKNINRLIKFARDRLDKTDRQYLAGISIFHQGIRYENIKNIKAFTPFYSIEFIINYSYFGNIDFDLSTPTDDPTLIKTPLLSLTTNNFLKEGSTAFQYSLDEEIIDIDALNRLERNIELKVNNKIKQTDFTIFKSKEKKVFPFFIGNGNVNYLCGKCKTKLASNIWEVSLFNIVFKCPSCDSYNEIEYNPDISTPIKGTIGWGKGVFEFSASCDIGQGEVNMGGLDPPVKK